MRYIFKKWLFNTKNLVIIVLGVFVNKIIIAKIYSAFEKTGQPFCIIESGMAVSNSGLIVLLLSIFFVMIMSDYPIADASLLYQLIRCGREKWFIAQIKFAIVAISLYLILVLGFCLVSTADISFIANGWSMNISNYSTQVGLSEFIPLQLCNQMRPYKAYFISIVLLFCYFYFLLGIQMLGFSLGKKTLFGVLQMGILFGGMCFVFFRKKIMWLFPLSHSILWIHYDKYFRKVVFPIWGSLLFFIVLGTVSYSIAYMRIRSCSLDSFREV